MGKFDEIDPWKYVCLTCQVHVRASGGPMHSSKGHTLIMASETETTDDPVNHPKHYTSDPSGIECIQITRHRNFNVGNAIKYLWRAGLKESDISGKGVEDLEKAIWYIKDEIKRIESTGSK